MSWQTGLVSPVTRWSTWDNRTRLVRVMSNDPTAHVDVLGFSCRVVVGVLPRQWWPCVEPRVTLSEHDLSEVGSVDVDISQEPVVAVLFVLTEAS